MGNSDDFQDDGGTPMWRARRARVIDVGRPARKRISFFQKIYLVIFFGSVVPFLVLFGGLALMAIWDALTRH